MTAGSLRRESVKGENIGKGKNVRGEINYKGRGKSVDGNGGVERSAR